MIPRTLSSLPWWWRPAGVPESRVKSRFPMSWVKSRVPESWIKSRVPKSWVKSRVLMSLVKSRVPESWIKSRVPVSWIKSIWKQIRTMSIITKPCPPSPLLSPSLLWRLEEEKEEELWTEYRSLRQPLLVRTRRQ